MGCSSATPVETMQPLTQVSGYLVEASGWDAEGNFFVETSDLHWDGAGAKSIQLRGPVCGKVQPGSMLFLRLLDATGGGDRFPVPHHVESVSLPDDDGWWLVHLVQSHPRPALSEPPLDAVEHLMFRLVEEVRK
jgi:hypothetical protein